MLFGILLSTLSYTLLGEHPGDSIASDAHSKQVAASNVVHWFRCDRPGQLRGLPDLLPSLPLFAQLRRYTLAVIAAAETAADLAVVMKTTAPAGGEAAEVEDIASEMEIPRNTMGFIPDGWEPYQIKAEQPATTYDMFKREILNEIARCLNMPYNIAAANSSGYNYASGRLDHQTYYKSINVEQLDCEAVVLDRIFAAWLDEARLALDELPRVDQTRHQWFWEGHEHVDPAKEATAQATRLLSHTTTLANEYALQGLDWQTELKQLAKENALMDKLGLNRSAPAATPADGDEDEDETGDTDESKTQEQTED